MTARLVAVQGDITRENTDAIVNAANSALAGGGGVDGAIHRAAGPALAHACQRVRTEEWPAGLPVGQAVVTEAAELPCRIVVHTVGPNWHRGQRDPRLLASCFTTSLAEAARAGATSISFPAVSAGIYGWDAPTVAQVAVGAVRAALDAGRAAGSDGEPVDVSGIELVRFVLFNAPLLAAFQDAVGA